MLGHGNKSQNRWLYISGTLIFLLIIAVIKYGLDRVEQGVRKNTIESLKTILYASHDTISRIWLNNLYYDASEIIAKSGLTEEISLMLAIRHDADKLKKHPARGKLIDYFVGNEGHLNGTGFDVISHDYINILSTENDHVGKKNVISHYYPIKIAKVFSGLPQFIPLVYPYYHERDEEIKKHSVKKLKTEMYYLVPVRVGKKIIASVAIRLNPYQTINSIAWTGRIGRTGETYLFDQEARLVTESRFQEQLVRDGYLNEDESSIHNVALLDPTIVRSKKRHAKHQVKPQELTFMARNALERDSGESLSAYRNYLGVSVLGVWLWDEQLDIGVATEINEYEALEPYRYTRAIVLTMFGFILFCSLAFLYFIRLMRSQNRDAIEESEAYLSVVLANAADGIITIDDKGIIQTFNLAAEKLFKYSAVEVINRNVDIIVPQPYKSNHTSYLENYKRTGEPKLIGQDRRLNALRKDGSAFPINIALRMIEFGGKKIFVAILRDLTGEIETQKKLQHYQEELESLVQERTSALIETEALNKQILQSAGEGIYGLDTEGKAIFVNPAAASMLGYEAEELIGELIHAMVHHTRPDGSPYPRDECPMYATFSDGTSHHVSDEVLWRKDGSSFPVEYTSKPIYRNNEIVGAVVTFSDISERLETEKKLRNINMELEDFKLSLDMTKDAVFMFKPGNFKFFYVNSGAIEQVGYGFDELMNMRAVDIKPEINEEQFAALVQPMLDGETNLINFETVHEHKDGHRVPVEINLQYLKPEGREPRFLALVRDNTERKHIEERLKNLNTELEQRVDERTAELARSQSILNRAQQIAHLGSWNWNIRTGEQTWSDEIYRILGLEPQESEPTYDAFVESIHPDDRDMVSAAVDVSMAHPDTPYNIEHRILLANGEVRYVHGQAEIELDAGGKPSYMIGIVHDITEQVHTRQELITATETAEMASRAKSEFLAVMSHEIRTPMNAIIGMSNLVMNTELKPRQRSYLKKVVNSAESLLHIINDILDFSKIEAGQLHLENIEFQLEEVFDKLTHLVVLKAQEKELEFLFSMSPDIPRNLLGDPIRLLQVLVNLASNAVKFTEQGEVVLSVDMEAKEADQVRLKFAVRDTGIGIEPEKQQRLFKSFSQADASITRKYGGTGLGLAIVKRLVNLMGGEVGFESEVGKGSCFYFSVPFGYSQSANKIDHALPKDVENLRVLVVDDSDSARTIISETLASFGFKVDIASSSNEAISAVETAEQRGNAYHLVLMDWKMPGQSGVDGARVILGKSKSPAPPMVMMVTAYSEDDLASEIENLDIASILTKPVNPSTLLDTILNVFKRQELKHLSTMAQLEKAADPGDILAGSHVLVVEDNELNMELALELLKEVGVQTSSAVNGKEAIKCIKENHFDGVLMDVHMPVMDGMEATRIIRQKAQYHSLPIIALTADALDSDREDILSVGMNDVIVKPIKVELMLETMAKWIHPANNGRYLQAVQADLDETDINLSIPGIDTRAGLETCNGKVSLYRKLLKKFIDEVEFIEQFKDAMAADDLELAERLAHTLKGTAGNIGAKDIQEAAKDLQNALKENTTKKKINQLYKKLAQQLVPVIQALSRLDLGPARGENASPGSSDLSSLLPAFDELAKLLADDDTDATEMIDQISAELKNSPFAVDIAQIEKYVNRYEFREALDLLNVLIEKVRVENR